MYTEIFMAVLNGDQVVEFVPEWSDNFFNDDFVTACARKGYTIALAV